MKIKSALLIVTATLLSAASWAQGQTSVDPSEPIVLFASGNSISDPVLVKGEGQTATVEYRNYFEGLKVIKDSNGNCYMQSHRREKMEKGPDPYQSSIAISAWVFCDSFEKPSPLNVSAALD